MPFKDQKQCKICSSLLRPEIDTMIYDGAPYNKILTFAKKRGLDIGKHNISKHKKNHTQIGENEIEARFQEEQTKIKTKEVERAVVGKFVAAATVLQEVVNLAFQGIEERKLTPTIDHAIKAIELQAKLKEGHGLESQLIDFMMEFTKEPERAASKTSLRIIKTTTPAGMTGGLEEITGARIRHGMVDSLKMAGTGDYPGMSNVRRIEATEEEIKQKETVETDLPEPKRIIVQTSLFSNIIPEKELDTI